MDVDISFWRSLFPKSRTLQNSRLGRLKDSMKYKLFRDLNHVIKREALVDTIWLVFVSSREGKPQSCLTEKCGLKRDANTLF